MNEKKENIDKLEDDFQEDNSKDTLNNYSNNLQSCG